MTNEELTAAFPECERIKREQVAPFVEQVFNEVESWRQIGYKIKGLCQKLWPKPEGVKWEDPLHQEWSHYFYGNWDTGQKDFDKWTDLLEDEYLRRTGVRRTMDEACQVAADEWTRMIFGVHIQDNGDKSESGFFGMMLATIVKDKAAKKATPEIIEKFRSLCRDYYRSGCIYEPTNHRCEPYCDYHPNSPLADLLIKAGMKADDIGFLCPVKTGILIDDRDYTVVVRGYQTERYI